MIISPLNIVIKDDGLTIKIVIIKNIYKTD